MAVQKPSTEAINRVQELLAQEFPDPAPPQQVNIPEARMLTQPEVLHFRGKEYRYRPIPFEVGLDLLEISIQAQTVAEKVKAGSAGAETLVQYRAMVRKTAAILGRIIRPWYLRWLPNPFRTADLGELQHALRFFARRGTNSPSELN